MESDVVLESDVSRMVVYFLKVPNLYNLENLICFPFDLTCCINLY